MKRLLFFLVFLICSICAFSQFPTGFPTQFNTGWNRWGYSQSDSGTIVALRDTAWVPRFPGTIVTWRQLSDTSNWMYTGQRWVKLLKTGDVAAVSANNGLSVDNNVVQLGGALIKDTEIDGTNLFGIAATGLTFLNVLNGTGLVTDPWSSILALPQSINFRTHQPPAGVDQRFEMGQTDGLISINTHGVNDVSDLAVTIDTVNKLKIIGRLSSSVSSGDSVLTRDPGTNQIRVRAQSDITSGVSNNTNITPGYRWLIPSTQQIKGPANSNTILWDSTSTANTLTAKADTSVLATQFDLSSAQNIQQVLTKGDTTNLDIIWRPLTQPEQIFTETWVPSNFGTVYPGFGEASLFNIGWGRFNGVNASGRPNVVGNLFSYNAPMGGGRINTNEASYRFGAETHFETGGQQLFEIHMPEIYTQSGVGLRPFSMYINKLTGATQYNMLAAAGAQYSDISGRPLFGFNVSGNYAFVGRTGSSQITLYDDSTTGTRYQMLLTPGSGMGHNTFGLQHIWDSRQTFNNTFDNSAIVTVNDARNVNDVTSITINASSLSSNSKNVFSAVGSVGSAMITKMQNTNTTGTSSFQLISNSGSSTINAVGMFNSAAASFGAIVANSPYLLGSSASPYVMMNNNAAGTIVFATGGTAERARFNAAGFFGLGTGATVDRLLHAEVADAVTNAVTYGQRWSHVSSGTVANGFGTGQEAELENASGTNVIAFRRNVLWTDATNASEDADFTLDLVAAGSLAERFRLFSTGSGRFSGGLFLGSVPNGVAGTDSILTISNTGVGKIPASTFGNLYTTNGTLGGARVVSGASNSLTLGSTGSPVSSLIVNSSDDIRLKGGIVLQAVRANDANYTVLETDLSVRLPTITADRTITINFNIADTGKVLTIINGNATAFRWNVGTGSLVTASGRTLDYFEPSTNYTLQYVGVDGGSAEWRVIGIQGYPAPRVSSAGTVTMESSVYDRAEYVATGTTSTHTLPTGASTLVGFTFSLKNRGSGILTVDVNGGGADIYDAAAVTSVLIAAGGSRDFVWDGSFWNAK